MINILLVDDKEDFYDFLEDHIKNTSYSADVTLTWVPDPDNLPVEHFNIYFVDNRYYGQDCGAECIDKIIARHPGAVIYALSGHANIDFLKALFNSKVSGFIDKQDYKLEDLDEIITAHIKTHAIYQELSSRLDKINESRKKLL